MKPKIILEYEDEEGNLVRSEDSAERLAVVMIGHGRPMAVYYVADDGLDPNMTTNLGLAAAFGHLAEVHDAFPDSEDVLPSMIRVFLESARAYLNTLPKVPPSAASNNTPPPGGLLN